MQQNKALNSDTIIAEATPPGHGGVGIVRISGSHALNIAEKILSKKPKPRYAHYGEFYNQRNEVIDLGITLYFKAPHSFTGEDVVELQAHGGPMIMRQLLQTGIHHGARLARAGEFSERAFLNNKIDLAQAEAIADVINAVSEQAARQAVRSLSGAFSEKIYQLLEALIKLRLYIEAAIDFPEEEIDFITNTHVQADLNTLSQSLNEILHSAKEGVIHQAGLTLVLAGSPNAGKSTLLNCLAGSERAIVTEIAGTTRDVMREHIVLDGIPVHIIDTAGLRESEDIVEQEGIRRALKAIHEADHVLLIRDARERESVQDDYLQNLPDNIPITDVINKIDLTKTQPGVKNNTVYISAKNQLGIEDLKQHLKQTAGLSQTQETGFSARSRHCEALEKARASLESGQVQLHTHKAPELLAEDLRQAQMALNEITGEFTSDDLLGKIFSSFCIGK